MHLERVLVVVGSVELLDALHLEGEVSQLAVDGHFAKGRGEPLGAVHCHALDGDTMRGAEQHDSLCGWGETGVRGGGNRP